MKLQSKRLLKIKASGRSLSLFDHQVSVRDHLPFGSSCHADCRRVYSSYTLVFGSYSYICIVGRYMKLWMNEHTCHNIHFMLGCLLINSKIHFLHVRSRCLTMRRKKKYGFASYFICISCLSSLHHFSLTHQRDTNLSASLKLWSGWMTLKMLCHKVLTLTR